MINFQAIEWQNFLSTGNAPVRIELDENPTTLIVGKNGAGKSTLLDALCYVLFGRAFRKINIPQLVNSINGRGMLVTVWFKIGQINYIVRRGYKPSVFEIYKEEMLQDQDARVDDQQATLEKTILKMNIKTFKQIFVLGSGSFTPFMQMKASERREVIEDLLDLEIFSIMASLLKEKNDLNTDDMKSVEYEAKLANEKLSIHQGYLTKLEEKTEDSIAQKAEIIENKIADVTNLTTELDGRADTLSDLRESISDRLKIQSSLDKLIQYEGDIEKNKTKLENEINFYEENDDCPECQQSIDKEFKTTIVEKKQTKITELQNGLDKIATSIDGVSGRNKQIQEIMGDIAGEENEILLLKGRINSLKQFIEDAQTAIKNEATGDVEVEKEILTDLSDALREIHDKKISHEKKAQLYSICNVLLRDTGIKSRIIKQYVPVMNKLLNKYLAAFDFFVQFEIDENFVEKIKSRHRDDFSYYSFSEGQKMRIDLAILFTWRAIARLKNSASTNLLILDEIFDGSLDGDGTEEFMKIIKELASENNIFIISHKQDQVGDNFDRVLRFELKKNFTTMEV